MRTFHYPLIVLLAVLLPIAGSLTAAETKPKVEPEKTAVAKPTPVIPIEIREEVFRTLADATLAQSSLEHTAQYTDLTARQTAATAAQQKAANYCIEKGGASFTLGRDKDGGLVCQPKPIQEAPTAAK